MDGLHLEGMQPRSRVSAAAPRPSPPWCDLPISCRPCLYAWPLFILAQGLVHAVTNTLATELADRIDELTTETAARVRGQILCRLHWVAAAESAQHVARRHCAMWCRRRRPRTRYCQHLCAGVTAAGCQCGRDHTTRLACDACASLLCSLHPPSAARSWQQLRAPAVLGLLRPGPGGRRGAQQRLPLVRLRRGPHPPAALEHRVRQRRQPPPEHRSHAAGERRVHARSPLVNGRDKLPVDCDSLRTAVYCM
jgi:hypothetical protein